MSRKGGLELFKITLKIKMVMFTSGEVGEGIAWEEAWGNFLE